MLALIDQSVRQRLPPYGREVLFRRRQGEHGKSGLLSICLDWRIRAGWSGRIVVPEDFGFVSLNWRPLTVGMDVQILYFHHDIDRARALAEVIKPYCAGLHCIESDLTGHELEVEVIRTAVRGANGR